MLRLLVYGRRAAMRRKSLIRRDTTAKFVPNYRVF
jgi:hypothetical protein